MYIYVFGSICRGEIDVFSDVDLLAITQSNEKKRNDLDTQLFSIYQEKRLIELWNEGNPFAWHLHLESKLVFSDNNEDIIRQMGEPKGYINLRNDLSKFSNLFYDSLNSLLNSNDSSIFDLSMIFLAIRNFASCYSLGHLKEPNFSRDSAFSIKYDALGISIECFNILERARILSTRGLGDLITSLEMKTVLEEIDTISKWFQLITKKI